MKKATADMKLFVIDATGKAIGVLLDMSTYERLREAAEDNAKRPRAARRPRTSCP